MTYNVFSGTLDPTVIICTRVSTYHLLDVFLPPSFIVLLYSYGNALFWLLQLAVEP